MSVIHRALSRSESEQQPQSSSYNPLTPQSASGRHRAWPWVTSVLLLSGTLMVLLWPGSPVQETTPGVQTAVAETPADPTEPSGAPTTEQARTATHSEPATGLETVPEKTIGDLTPATASDTQTDAPVASEATAAIASEPSEPSIPRSAPDLPEPGPHEAAVPDTTATRKTVETAQTAPTPAPSVSAAVEETSAATIRTASVIRSAEVQWQTEIEQAIESGAIEQAEAKLKRWIGAQPKAETPRLWLAKIYINNGIYPAAEPLIQSLDSAEAKALMGVIYERTGRHTQAANVFEGLYRAQPDQGQWLLFWAINTENSRQPVKSRQLYQAYLDQFPQQDESLQRFAAQRLRTIEGS